MGKNKLLHECADIMARPKVSAWYAKNLESKPQYESLNSLEKGVSSGALTVREALGLMLIVGVQWHDKFKGVS